MASLQAMNIVRPITFAVISANLLNFAGGLGTADYGTVVFIENTAVAAGPQAI